jgi:integrase
MNAMEERTNIYIYRRDDYDSEMKRIKEWNNTQRNKDILLDYYNSLLSTQATAKRVYKIGCQLRLLCTILGKNLDEVIKKDIIRVIATINQKPTLAEATKCDYRRIIKAFYKWYKHEDIRLKSQDLSLRSEIEEMYRYISEDVKRGEARKKIDYSNIISETDCRVLLEKGCNKPIEKAIVSVLHESGCRVGEFLGLRIKDILLKDDYALLSVDGKTGERRIPIIQSIPYLTQWLELHPQRNNPNALVWIVQGNRHEGKPYHWVGIIKTLRRVMLKSGLKKKCNPHWFRHSRATILVEENYTEEIIRNIMGWTAGSDEIKTYIHIGAKQVEKAFQERNGLLKEEIKIPKITHCSCGKINSSEARYCIGCGRALSVGIMLEDEVKKKDAINEAFELFSKIMSNPELREKFEQFKLDGGEKK